MRSLCYFVSNVVCADGQKLNGFALHSTDAAYWRIQMQFERYWAAFSERPKTIDSFSLSRSLCISACTHICQQVCVCVLTPNRPKRLINFAAWQCALVMATRKDLRRCPQPASNVGRTTSSLPAQAWNIIHGISRRRNTSFALCVSTATIHLTEKGGNSNLTYDNTSWSFLFMFNRKLTLVSCCVNYKHQRENII